MPAKNETKGAAAPGLPQKAAFYLSSVETVEDAARKIVAVLAATLEANTNGAYEDRDPEYVHQMRVALRMLRFALRIFDARLAPGRQEHLRGEIRWLGGVLGDVRDLDVIRKIGARITAREGFDDDFNRYWNDGLEHRRAEKIVILREALVSERYVLLKKQLAQWSKQAGIPPAADRKGRPVHDFVALQLSNAIKLVRKKQATPGNPERLHEQRIALKRLRYTTEFFAGVYPGNLEKHIRFLRNFQDKLGAINDCLVAAKFLEDLGNTALKEKKPDRRMLFDLGAVTFMVMDEMRARVRRVVKKQRVLKGDLKRLRRRITPS